jgi:hypothetical protein
MFGLDLLAQRIGVRLGVGGQRLEHLHFHIAAQLDVGAAAGHVGGDGHRPGLPASATIWASFSCWRALSTLCGMLSFCSNAESDSDFSIEVVPTSTGWPRRCASLISSTMAAYFSRACDRSGRVRRPARRAGWSAPRPRQAHRFPELVGFGRRGPGHPGKLVVEPEIVLEGDRGEGDVLGLDADGFLGLDRLVQPVGQPAALHHPAGEFVDQHHIVATHDVILVAGEQLVRAQALGDVMHQRRRFGIVKRLIVGQQAGRPQAPFHEFVARIGQGDVALFLVEREMLGLDLGDQLVDRDIEFAAILGRARDDQRRARLVDQDRIDLVDDGIGMAALHHLREFLLHVVPQIVEAKLVVGGIGDVAAIGGALFRLGLLGHHDAGGQPQGAIDLAHPVGVAPGQIVVDRDDVHAAAGQRVQIGREGGDQRLALAGLHLGDVALVQKDAAHQLHIERPKPQRTARRLAAVGERLGQEVVQRLAVGHPRLQRCGRLDQLGVAAPGGFFLERIDRLDQRAGRLDLAVVCGAKDFAGNGS